MLAALSLSVFNTRLHLQRSHDLISESAFDNSTVLDAQVGLFAKRRTGGCCSDAIR